jgi:hypothetical protein
MRENRFPRFPAELLGVCSICHNCICQSVGSFLSRPPTDLGKRVASSAEVRRRKRDGFNPFGAADAPSKSEVSPDAEGIDPSAERLDLVRQFFGMRWSSFRRQRAQRIV